MSAGQICSRIMATASPGESIRAAARRMAEYDVGTLVVLKENRGSRAVGIITDRDIVVRCVADGLDTNEMLVSDVMTTPVHTVRDSTSIGDAMARMASTGARRLVVVEDGDRVAGILSLDDILGQVLDEGTALRGLLQKQQPHVPV
jgi:CBS domain-containing protein